MIKMKPRVFVVACWESTSNSFESISMSKELLTSTNGSLFSAWVSKRPNTSDCVSTPFCHLLLTLPKLSSSRFLTRHRSPRSVVMLFFRPPSCQGKRSLCLRSDLILAQKPTHPFHLVIARLWSCRSYGEGFLVDGSRKSLGCRRPMTVRRCSKS